MLSVVVVFTFVVGWSLPVFAGPVHIYHGNFNLRIPAEPNNPAEPNSSGWMADAVIEILDDFTIYDLDVGINLTHTNVFDLQLFLQSPLGTTVCLNMYNAEKGFSVYSNYTNTIFDDEAEVSIKQAEPPFSGQFRPIGPDKLSKFDGEQVNGRWRLRIYDAWQWDTGTLDSFELTITTPEPATAILMALGAALMRLHKSRHNRRNI